MSHDARVLMSAERRIGGSFEKLGKKKTYFKRSLRFSLIIGL
jgi:hypothetical protein